MKTKRLFLFIMFCGSLLVGLRLGTSSNPANPQAIQAINPSKKPSLADGGQNGIWIIVVDTLKDKTPQLKGVWLFSYLSNYIAIKPFFIFPSDNAQQDAELSGSFQLNTKNQIVNAFWNVLDNHGHQVRDYIIADDIALEALINFYGGIKIRGKMLDGKEVLAQVYEKKGNVHSITFGQITVVENICNNIINSTMTSELKNLIPKMNNHLLSNLNLKAVAEKWQTMNDGSIRVCDFSDLLEKLQVNANP